MTKGFVVWFTGLSGSGKTTIAEATKNVLSIVYKINNVIILDGDEIRTELNDDLGFSDEDRTENIRRIAKIANLLKNKGFLVIVATISPRKKQRELAKFIIGKDSFMEVFINTPLKICKERDPKGLYKKAQMGNIQNFTGITDIYETPSPETAFWLSTEFRCVPSCVKILMYEIKRRFTI